MKKIKVRISKNPNGGEGKFINKTAAFLYGGTKKARVGMQQDSQAIKNEILDQFTLTNSVEDVIDHLQSTFGLSYIEAEAEVEDVKELLHEAEEKRIETEEMVPDSESEDEVIKKEKLYSLTDEWVSDDDSGWDDFDEDTEDADNEITEDLMKDKSKTGGSIGKKKFVKNIVNGLKKAAEGMEQEQRNANPSILDTPVNGRDSFIGGFKRGIKNLGNEFYAKEIYDHTKKLQEEVKSLPSMPMAQEGMEMSKPDLHDAWDHLQAYSGSVSNIFNTPMNQVHGAGYEQMPEARRGREQRQERRQQRKMGKDWDRMFGDMAAGYSGVSGLPDYLQFISPQIVQAPQGQQGSGQAPQGPFIDVQYKKGPWWSGKREWSAKGIPAAMLSGMMGAGRGMMPGFGYMPAAYGSSYGSSWSTHSTYPGEIVRRTASNINAAADPGKTSPGLKNNPTTGSYGPGYDGFNADSNGNGIPDYLENPNPQGTNPNVTPDASTLNNTSGNTNNNTIGSSSASGSGNSGSGLSSGSSSGSNSGSSSGSSGSSNSGSSSSSGSSGGGSGGGSSSGGGGGNSGGGGNQTVEPSETKDNWGRPEGSKWYGFDPDTKEWTKGKPDWKLQEEKKTANLPKLKKDKWGRSETSQWYGFDPKTKKYTLGDLKGKTVKEKDEWIRDKVINSPQFKEMSKDTRDLYSKPQAAHADDELITSIVLGGARLPQVLGKIASKALFGSNDKTNTATRAEKQKGANKIYKDYWKSTRNNDRSLGYDKAAENARKWREYDKIQDYIAGSGDFLDGRSWQDFMLVEEPLNAMNPWKDFWSKQYEKGPWNKKQKADKKSFGGPVNDPMQDPFGNLQKFVLGGNDNEMNISPIVYYDNNDISTKDTTDPYYRRGGLVKAAGGWTVTGDVKGSTNPQYQSPAFQRFNPNLSEQQNKAAFDYLKSSGTLDPNATYDNTKIYATGQNQGGYKPNVTTRPSGGGYGGGYQYPVQPKGLLEEIRDTFGIFKRNPQTGRNYDFEWMSQRGPIMNAQGQIFQPQGSVRQGNTSGGFQEGDEVRADGSVWRNGVQISDGKGTIMENFGSSGKGQPNQAGYYYDYERVDKPFSHKMTVKGNWIDPNNPSTFGYGSNKQYTGAPFLSNEPYREQPMQANALNEPKSDSDTRSNDKDSRRDARLDRKIARWDRRAERNVEEYEPMEGSIKNYENPDDFYNAINPVSREDAQFLGAGYTASEDYQNKGKVTEVTPTKEPMSNEEMLKSQGRVWDEKQQKWLPKPSMQFGGYIPTFDPGGQFSGMGPFDPNNTSIATGGVGPCTEEAVKNAKPGDPCYNEAYVDSNTPQDFTAEYDINKARTLNLTGVANLGAAAGYAAQGIGQTMQNIYDENYLNELTGSDNRDVLTYTPTRGGYSGLDQRIGSKGQGRGSTGFNRVVGTDAFTKEGGELKYKKGGVYDLTQEEIGKILAAGGQIKFL